MLAGTTDSDSDADSYDGASKEPADDPAAGSAGEGSTADAEPQDWITVRMQKAKEEREKREELEERENQKRGVDTQRSRGRRMSLTSLLTNSEADGEGGKGGRRGSVSDVVHVDFELQRNMFAAKSGRKTVSLCVEVRTKRRH